MSIGSDNSEIFYWLALDRVPRVGPLSMARLKEAFGSPQAALDAGAQDIRRIAGLGERLARAIAEFVIPRDDILRDMEALDRMAARVVTRWCPEYPSNLQEIYDPPALLFVRGALVPEDFRAVAVVGTREPTQYGITMTRNITADLVSEGVTLVSGLARGVDTACHQTALKCGGRTIGVLGCGLDVVYPKENGPLMDKMVASGAVITEFRPGMPPMGTNFYRRNRIVSGLAHGVVVVEAGPKSGSLITAQHAIDQNRDVFAVPGNVTNKRSSGPHGLIRDGAGLVESGADVMAALFGSSTPEPVQQSLFDTERAARSSCSSPLGDPVSDRADTAAERAGLPEPCRSVLAALELDPVPIDMLCEALRMSPGQLAGLLLDLELQGLVRQHPGKMFSLP